MTELLQFKKIICLVPFSIIIYRLESLILRKPPLMSLHKGKQTDHTILPQSSVWTRYSNTRKEREVLVCFYLSIIQESLNHM